jgi:hypothetical protein
MFSNGIQFCRSPIWRQQKNNKNKTKQNKIKNKQNKTKTKYAQRNNVC